MLRLCNNYSTLTATAFIMRDLNCPDRWLKFGWYNLQPGECRDIYTGCASAVNRFWYFHAEAIDGSFWAGQFEYCVQDPAFQWCLNRCDPGGYIAGFRELDVNSFCNFTLTLSA
ncbi:DUF1036 domain-containing protein [Streptomyces triculaminicus]|uniref:DUF1036 domain-containing protein n=1 Tax=Streptomyces triculaminicus TaxID=2816232 RepID=UPI0033F76E70